MAKKTPWKIGDGYVDDDTKIAEPERFGLFVDVAREAADEMGEFEVMVYSGRHMRGAMCFAITFPEPINLAWFGFKIGEKATNYTVVFRDYIEQIREAGMPQVDQLGKGVVIYWPKVEV